MLRIVFVAVDRTHACRSVTRSGIPISKKVKSLLPRIMMWGIIPIVELIFFLLLRNIFPEEQS